MSANWPSISLGELIRLERRPVELQPEQQYQEIGIYCFGRGIFHKTPRTGLEVGDKNLYELREGDLILQVTFAWEGAIALCSRAENGLFGSTRYPTFRVDEARCYAPFLVRYLGTRDGLDQINKICPGSAGRNRVLSLKRIHEVMIPLPPLPEQRRIVARIDELFAKINEARGLRKKAHTERDLLSIKQIESFFLPYRKEMVRIGDVFRVTTGGTPSRGNPTYWNGDVNWVSSGEVAFCRIKQTYEKITCDGVENSNAKVNPPSTVLLAMIGQGKTRGQCAILDCYAATNQNVAAIHLYKTEHLPEYLYWWLFANYQKSRATETGTAQPALSGERVKQIRIPIPPVDEQRRIVAELNVWQARVEALKHLQTETAVELEALLSSILDRAFKGEL